MPQRNPYDFGNEFPSYFDEIALIDDGHDSESDDDNGSSIIDAHDANEANDYEADFAALEEALQQQDAFTAQLHEQFDDFWGSVLPPSTLHTFSSAEGASLNLTPDASQDLGAVALHRSGPSYTPGADSAASRSTDVPVPDGILITPVDLPAASGRNGASASYTY